MIPAVKKTNPGTKRLGIIGGMGARAGVLFMQKVVDYSPVCKDQDFIEMILHSNSCIPDRTRAILYDGDSPEEELIRSVEGFDPYRIDVIVLACMTAYHYYDVLQPRTRACILHPAKVLGEHLEAHYPGARRIGVLASTGAIRAGIFGRLTAAGNREIITLDDDAQESKFMRSLYMPGGLKSGVITEEARRLFFDAVADLDRKGVDVLVGGCSEVSILLNDDTQEIPYVDIMDLLAKEAVRLCYGSNSAVIAF